MQSASEHQDWQIPDWRLVLFTDENRFTLAHVTGETDSGDAVENILLPAISSL